jgi:hypothetical protein
MLGGVQNASRLATCASMLPIHGIEPDLHHQWNWLGSPAALTGGVNLPASARIGHPDQLLWRWLSE